MTALPAHTRATPLPDLVRVRLLRLRRPVPQTAGPSRRLTAEDPRMLLSKVLTAIDETATALAEMSARLAAALAAEHADLARAESAVASAAVSAGALRGSSGGR